MNVAVFVSTPAQFHFYKNIVRTLNNSGVKVYILARDYGETLDLLNETGFEYFVFSRPPKGAKRILSLPSDIHRAVSWLRNKNIDIVTGFEIYGAYTSKLLKVPYVQFYDSEPSIHKLLSIQFKLMMPATDVVLTPESFRDNLGRKHLRIASYKELAYLHPNYYKPNDDILDMLGISTGEEYAVLRFNAFDAAHDEGIAGFSSGDKIKLVKELEKHVRVFISPEGKIPKELEKYVLKVPKSRIHDVLYYAKLLVTDTQTMATEAALLGTPVVRSNKFVGPNDMSNFIELEERFGLMYNITDRNRAIEKAVEIAQTEGIKKEWRGKREKLLEKKIDMTSFMVWFLENYPESLEEFKQNPNIQYRFR
ncbi:DUF354 domain-containing protein [Thermococcus sp. M36]|uniref:DUF354 domain-containing protein n=1 Tax=Thermococcus sp. M36 TaxID=1638261 RepID=UPI00143987BA|nr:DUF354 domain-containing protein [Thermococcus sp. M36]NJE05722.1 DUF354 domain-containing protein [Thermococcus sp. M36]